MEFKVATHLLAIRLNVGVNITRMEFKENCTNTVNAPFFSVNITRMEFKEAILWICMGVLSSVNITRMEFKVDYCFRQCW